MQYVHSPLAYLFFDQSAWNFGSMPKIKISDRHIFYFFHYEEALTSLRTPGGRAMGNKNLDDPNSRSQLLLEAFEILNIYSASAFGSSPFQALKLEEVALKI